MKANVFPLLILILASLTAGCSKSTDSQEGTLSGVVTYDGQEDHSGIVVQFRELGFRTTTTTAGNYSFSAVPAGTYSILATDGDTTRQIFDFSITEDISVVKGRNTTVPAMELPLFQRIEDDLNGQVRWTSEDSPYLIARTVTVLPGSHLTVEPGTIIKFADYYRLIVMGDIVVKGSITDSVLFTSAQIDGAPGDWDRITIQDSGQKALDTLSYCRIQYANIGLYCSQASPVISENNICHCFGYAIISAAAAPEICRNFLTDNYGGISCTSGSAAIIQGNIIEGNSFAGINCTGSNPQISNNIISHNQRGLQIQSGATPFVWHNQIRSNEDALYLYLYCAPLIEANDISEQQRFGLFIVGHNKPQIHFNNIAHNGSYGIYLNDHRDDVQAQNNWWGTSVASEIDGLIWDRNDNSTQGLVLINPFLAAPLDTAGLQSSF